PKLKIVSVEAGCGWAAYLMDRLDEKHGRFGGGSLRPSEYIRRNCYFVAEPEERTIGAMLELVGEDRILWGSDYPHVDSYLDPPQQIRHAVADLSPARQAGGRGGDARRVVGV